MAGKIDLDKVKAAATALGVLNGHEFDFLKTYLAMTWGKRAAKELDQITPSDSAAAPEPEKKRRGPDKRGHYKCGKCTKVLPTKRGRAIHEASHETLDTTQLPLTGVK